MARADFFSIKDDYWHPEVSEDCLEGKNFEIECVVDQLCSKVFLKFYLVNEDVPFFK